MAKSKPNTISIIIRSKNEEKWIGRCLDAVINQKVDAKIEVIIVDNNSTDHTVEVAKRYPIKKCININKFLPGKALNNGIRASSGNYIVCLSAHCIPEKETWLQTMLGNFIENSNIAGVYGRQLPLSFTDPVDKRDLLIVFGLDKRIQLKDYFFHNANCMIPRSIWEEFTFDEEVINIEDRVWGKEVIQAGYKIIYEPEAAVYHHHGLHQGNTPERVKGVISIVERVDEKWVNDLPESLRPENANIVAVVPMKGQVSSGTLEDRTLKNSISALQKARYVKKIYLMANDPSLADQFGVNGIDREKLPDIDSLSLDELMQNALQLIETQNDFPDALLYVNYDYLFRPEGLFDELIRDAQYKGYDTVFPGLVDYGHYWFNNGNEEFKQTDSSLKSRDQREPIYRALYGLGCLSAVSVIRSGKMVDGKIGILPIDSTKSSLRIRDLESEKTYSRFLNFQYGEY